jgi:hypothetical protein
MLLIAASVVLLGIGAVACGDDDDDDDDGGPATATGSGNELVDYLTKVNDIENSITTATNAIGEQSEEAFSDPAKARQALSAAVDAAESAVTALNALDPRKQRRIARRWLPPEKISRRRRPSSMTCRMRPVRHSTRQLRRLRIDSDLPRPAMPTWMPAKPCRNWRPPMMLSIECGPGDKTSRHPKNGL